jgi:hypothetical protein
MTDQPIQLPPVDMGNPFIGPGPAAITTFSSREVPELPPNVGGITVRGPGATMTLFGERAVLKAWAAAIDALADSLSGLILPAGTVLPLPPQNGHHL